jgi:integrase
MNKKNLPKIYPLSRDMKAEWFVSWRFKDENGCSKLVKERIPQLNTTELRLAYGQKIIKNWLENGWKAKEKHPHAGSLDVLKLAFEWLEARKGIVRRKTFFTYQSHLKNLDAFVRSKKIQTVNMVVADDFLTFLTEGGKAVATVNAHRTTFNQAFNFCVRKKLLAKNPFCETEKRSGESDSKMPFTKTQSFFVKSKMPEELWAAARWIYYCFIRPGELRQIRVGEVDWDEGKILVKSDISKNKKGEWVIIPAPLMKELKPLCLWQYNPTWFLVGEKGLPSETPVGYNFWSNRHLKLLKLLKFDTAQYSLYSWKHTGVYQLAKATKDYRAVQLQCRHHSLDMTMKYLRKIGIMEYNNIRDDFPEL